MKNKFLLGLILFLTSIFTISVVNYIGTEQVFANQNNKIGNNEELSNEAQKNAETPLYEKIGVSARCIYVWQIITAEGVWESDADPQCSQADIDKIEEYCKDDIDTCYNYDVGNP